MLESRDERQDEKKRTRIEAKFLRIDTLERTRAISRSSIVGREIETSTRRIKAQKRMALGTYDAGLPMLSLQANTSEKTRLRGEQAGSERASRRY